MMCVCVCVKHFRGWAPPDRSRAPYGRLMCNLHSAAEGFIGSNCCSSLTTRSALTATTATCLSQLQCTLRHTSKEHTRRTMEVVGKPNLLFSAGLILDCVVDLTFCVLLDKQVVYCQGLVLTLIWLYFICIMPFWRG